MAGLKRTEDTVTTKLENMLKSTSFFEQYVTSRFQPKFQQTQQKRWQTENASEGAQWQPLNPRYSEYKKEKYANEFGHGEKLMIATGRLYRSLTLDDGGEWERILSGNTVVFNFPIEYAKTAGETRPILEFSQDTMRGFRDDFRSWMIRQWQLRT